MIIKAKNLHAPNALPNHIYLLNEKTAGSVPEVVHAKEERENTPFMLSVHLYSNRGMLRLCVRK